MVDNNLNDEPYFMFNKRKPHRKTCFTFVRNIMEASRMKMMPLDKRIENRREQKTRIVSERKVAELILCGIVMDPQMDSLVVFLG